MNDKNVVRGGLYKHSTKGGKCVASCTACVYEEGRNDERERCLMNDENELHDLRRKIYLIKRELRNTLDLIVWNHTTKERPEGIPTQKVLDSLKKMVEIAK